ncbi:MAG: hypothetical protein AMJ55_08640, partial [Gammaproteobacteria bacterium SG8_15]
MKGKSNYNGETNGMIPYGLEIIGELHTTITSQLPAIPTFFSDTTLLHRRGNSILYTEKRRQSHV